MEELKKHRHFERGTVDVTMRVTKRDIAIVRAVAKHRFLSSDQIERLFPTETSRGGQVTERLTLLFRKGYLDKPKQQVEYHTSAGPMPHIYALANEGARLIAQDDELSEGKIDWALKNKRVGQLFIKHTVGIAEVMVGLEIASSKRADIRLVEAIDVLENAPSATQRRMHPWRFEGAPPGFARKDTVAVFPDAVCALDLDGKKSGRSHFVVEIDRGTMPVVRSAKLVKAIENAKETLAASKSPETRARAMREVEQSIDKLVKANSSARQSSFLKKFIAYHFGRTAETKWHTQAFGWKNFRVLTVTTSEKRIATMQQALSLITGGGAPNAFLFTTFDALRGSDDLLSHEWRNGNDERVTLI